MKELKEKDTLIASGGNNSWAQNDDFGPTIVRNAGLGAIGGSLGGPKGALVGAVVGVFVGINEYNNNQSNSNSGGGGGSSNLQCEVELKKAN